jgi:hypothetical protein
MTFLPIAAVGNRRRHHVAENWNSAKHPLQHVADGRSLKACGSRKERATTEAVDCEGSKKGL